MLFSPVVKLQSQQAHPDARLGQRIQLLGFIAFSTCKGISNRRSGIIKYYMSFAQEIKFNLYPEASLLTLLTSKI